MNFFQYITNRWFQGILILTAAVLCSCSPARYVPEGNYLLGKNQISTGTKTIPQDQLKGYIIQKPNKKILGTRFYLFLYNLSNLKKEKWPHNWLRKIGEEPVIYNPEMTKSSTAQLKLFLENKGYYHAEVSDSVFFKRRNAVNLYTIRFNEPYRVRKIRYTFEDTGLVSHILPDTINSILEKGMRFDKDILQQERIRIESVLKEQGYFSFSKEYIFYNATIHPEEYSVELQMHFKEYMEGIPDPRTKVKHHQRYRIGDITVFPNYQAQKTGVTGVIKAVSYDTTRFRGLLFLTNRKPNIKPNVIVNGNDIVPGEYYKLSDVNRTYRNLSELSLIRFTNITFRERDSVPVAGLERQIDCRIELTQKKIQSYQTEIAGTNSSGDLGVRGNLVYQNLNLFRGAEVYNMRLTGAIEGMKNRTDGKFKSMKEVGVDAGIVFPKFFSPFRLEGFVKKYAPKTTISASFNYQARYDYTRSISNSSFSYKWNGNPYLTHTLWPLELNYVQIYEERSQQDFLDSIKTTPLGYSFEDHVVNMARYSIELNNQTLGKSRNFIYTRINIESAGNLLNLYNETFNSKESETPYQFWGVPYFQYLLGDVDLRYYNVIDKQNRFVYRIFAGVGYPYGNSEALPYEKKYFSGGPNSIRAWSTRDLGPGSYVEPIVEADSNLYYFPNKNGDIKLEANLEYRFKVIWKMEGALFVDIGNIWSIREEVDKPGADFQWNRFYKEIAVGSGFGIRFDFSFFLLRFDFGIKLRDPALPENNRWVPVFSDFGFNDLGLKVGIGYPF